MKLTLLLEKGERAFYAGAQEFRFPFTSRGVPWFLCRRVSRSFSFSASIMMCTKEEQLEEAKKLLSDDFSFVIQEVKAHSCINGELVNKKFDKGRGVKLVRDYYGLTDEDTYGFGDSMNDLEMMQTVGTSVCMENGADALKEIADIVCPSVENDGLAKAFSQLGL